MHLESHSIADQNQTFYSRHLTSASDAIISCFPSSVYPRFQASKAHNLLCFTMSQRHVQASFLAIDANIIHFPALHNAAHAPSMNESSFFESTMYRLFMAFFDTIDSPHTANRTDKLLGLVKANVTEHMTTLLSTQNNQSIADMANCVTNIYSYSRKNNSSEKQKR